MFEEQSRDMVRSLLRTLTEKGHFSSKNEALKKLKDPEWIKERGYEHVVKILNSNMAIQECHSFFDELDTRLMKRLTKGIHEFRSKEFLSQKELFERLAKKQAPDALFITCSDSRIVPNLITQTDPGDLFIIRNAGNIIPPADARNSGESASIEFALKHLNIRDIIICGHSSCGAMEAIVRPEALQDLPMMTDWLKYANNTRIIIEKEYANASEKEKIDVAVQENVLVQMENLRTHPAVKAALNFGRLNLHGWVYDIRTGEVLVYYPELEQFLPIGKKPDSSQQKHNSAFM
ncbi:MAG: carbonic anhydrase [Candidatus Melainabacteria bacterium]|nr:carbonic anhydrase [Candidatus Melainabacteria bacterium]